MPTFPLRDRARLSRRSPEWPKSLVVGLLIFLALASSASLLAAAVGVAARLEMTE
jgi:hypothetical protein